MSSSIGSLYKRLERVREQHEQRQPKRVRITCYWGDETPPETPPGTIVIKTQWGAGPLDDENEDLSA